MYLRLMYIVSKLKIRQQYINRETHFPYILSTMIYNFVVQRANRERSRRFLVLTAPTNPLTRESKHLSCGSPIHHEYALELI